MILNKNAAAADSDDHTVKEGEETFGGRRFTEYLLDRDRISVNDNGAVFPGRESNTSVFGKACTVDPRVVDRFTRCVAMEATEEVERHRRLAVGSSMGE